MYTTTDEQGLLNNYATEPSLYYAEFPSPEQQRRYAQQATFAVLLVATLITIAFSVA